MSMVQMYYPAALRAMTNLGPPQRGMPKVWVLGERDVSQRIANELKNLGHEVVFTRDLEPSGGTAIDSIEKMTELLRAFARDIHGEGWVHPGNSPWAERREFACLCNTVGNTVGKPILFLGPSAKVLSLFADKFFLLTQAEKLGIPNLILNSEPLFSLREFDQWRRAEGHSKGQRFPFVLRAVRGSSRWSTLFVQDEEALRQDFPVWSRRLYENCKESLFFVEKALDEARWVRIPFMRRADGVVKVYPFVDASLKLGYRKVIEFCPARCLSPELQVRLHEWVTRFANWSDYVGVGVLEFLVEDQSAYLVDGLPRLNTSFALWEEMAGVSAVECQISALNGVEPATKVEPAEWQSGICIRWDAEDPLVQLPKIGRIAELSEKNSWSFPHLKAELLLNVERGQVLVSTDSGRLGQLLVLSRGKGQAQVFAQGILEEVWIAGSLQTNDQYLKDILTHPWVKEGIFHAHFLENDFVPSAGPSEEELQIGMSLVEMCNKRGGQTTFYWSSGLRRGMIASKREALKWMNGPHFLIHGSLNGRGKGVSGVLETEDGDAIRVCAYPSPDSLGNGWNIRLGSRFLVIRVKVAN